MAVGGEPSTASSLRQADANIGRAIGHYKIKSLIASGGMGTVYLAQQESPRRVVALKLMRRGVTSSSALRRFEFEAQLLGRLRHPGIAQIYESSTHEEGEGSVPYFAMEYVPSALDLTEYAQRKKLDTKQKLELFAKVCDAVAHGHQKGIIHRDLKPSNLLVDSTGQPKIIDFGVARATDSDMAVTTLQTDIRQLIGTLQYMSPEQCGMDALDIDTSSDVYALGVVLYELLCDQLPYDLSDVMAPVATRIIQEQEPVRPSAVNRTLRGDVETIVLKAMQKERGRRYRTAAELADDIQRYLDDEPISARPPGVIDSMRRFARKHRVVAAAVGGATALLPILAALLVWVSVLLQGALAVNQRDAEAARRLWETRVATERDAWSHLEAAQLAEAARRDAERGLMAFADDRYAEAAEVLLEALSKLDRADRLEIGSIGRLQEAILGSVGAQDLERARADLERLRSVVDEAEARPLARKIGLLELTETMVQIAGGEFEMGGDGIFDGKPIHTVHIERPFLLGQTEVTRGQFVEVMQRDPARFKDDPFDDRLSDDLNLPVESVSWLDAVEFCNKLSKLEGLTPRYRLENVQRDSGIPTSAEVELVAGTGYRLPTEAEWEFACRAGTTTAYSFDEGERDAHMWYRQHSGGQTRLVATRRPNPWGLHDLHGNVWEWVEDVWNDNYNGAPNDGSAWTNGEDPDIRVVRGGAWIDKPERCSSASRYGVPLAYRDSDVGFRVALDHP